MRDLLPKFPEGKDFQPGVCRRERGIWHQRFWEHVIRHERNYERQVDYIHYNPVKQGHVASVAGWPYSSFHHYVKRGIYPLEWAADDNVRSPEME